jgi:hypothetical protein
LFMMAWHSDFSIANFCFQYFQNPSTGMFIILVYSPVHRAVHFSH